ncbi:MAG: glutamate--tRNA ligase, partial [Propioniciclava sp.]|nr:glutamate--tRNA ligase [Propioniciclava sp.]
AAAIVDASLAVLEGLPTWDDESIQAALRARLVDDLGIKPKFAFGPVRVGVTGSRVSPPLFESMAILGRESSLARLKALREAL